MNKREHPSTRSRNGKPARQRYAHASAKKKPSQSSRRRWSQHVAETSDAMDLDAGIIKLDDPTAIARSLKHSSEHSRRRKGTAFQSASRC